MRKHEVDLLLATMVDSRHNVSDLNLTVDYPLQVEANGELIGHRTGGHEEGDLFPKHSSRHVLQPIYGGIFAVDIVPYFRTCHRLSHGLSGFRDRVAAQVDH